METLHVCSSGSGTGADREDIQVIETDYTKFALVLSLRQTSTLTIIRVSLLGEPLLVEAWSGWCLLGWGMTWGQMPHHHQVLRAALCAPLATGRNWRLAHRMIDKFVCLTRTQNLTKNNFIFPDVTGNGFAGSGRWEGGWDLGTMVAPSPVFTSPMHILRGHV